jgi:beta-lactamase regulating signal transducer with metallopeptidase domain
MSELLPILLAASVRITLLAIVVGALLAVLRIRSGATRHAAWFTVVVAMLLMPVLPRVVPGYSIVVPQARLEVFTGSQPAPGTRSSATATPPLPLVAAVDVALASQSSTQLPVAETRPDSSGAVAAPGAAPWWLRVLAALSVGVTAALLLRLAAGFWIARSLLRRSTSLGLGLRESPVVMTPVTVGVLRPQVLLPAAWREWPDVTVAAVLAHERAHVTRRDPLTALVARVNRCVFWWHPLAWWLERAVARAAEQACDDQALRAVGHPHAYADVLVQMAAAAQRAGGRISWAAVGVDGHSLGRRIDRVLNGQTGATTRARRWAVAAGAIGAVAVIAACRLEKDFIPRLPSQPRVSASPGRNIRAIGAERSARRMTWDEAAALTAEWQRNPENLAALERLLYFHQPNMSGPPSPDDARHAVARRPLVLWLIEHEPDSWVAQMLVQVPEVLFATPLDWLPDPASLAAAQRLWRAHAARPDVTSRTLAGAVWFLTASDTQGAERVLRQGRERFGPEFSAWLGLRYGQVIVGTNPYVVGTMGEMTDFTTSNVAVNVEFATRVRALLESSTDAALLVGAGQVLTVNAGEWPSRLDRRELGRGYINRAKQVDPSSPFVRRWQASRLWVSVGDYYRQQKERFDLGPNEWSPAGIAALPEPERLRVLIRQANLEYIRADEAEWRATEPQVPGDEPPARVRENRERAAASWNRSKRYAEEARALAVKLTDDPEHTDALFVTTVALGAHAVRERDLAGAVRHLLAAAEVPAPTYVMPQTLNWSLERRLIEPLIDSGEREAVARYFDRAALVRPDDRQLLLAAAAAVRDGQSPSRYERGQPQTWRRGMPVP